MLHYSVARVTLPLQNGPYQRKIPPSFFNINYGIYFHYHSTRTLHIIYTVCYV